MHTNEHGEKLERKKEEVSKFSSGSECDFLPFLASSDSFEMRGPVERERERDCSEEKVSDARGNKALERRRGRRRGSGEQRELEDEEKKARKVSE